MNHERSVHGFVADGFADVADSFLENLLQRGDRGAAFAAVVDGRPVVDIWGGLADADTGRRWDRATIGAIFSGTKGLVAACLLKLVERGELDLSAPVCSYWPDFAAQGKSDILVRHVVSHQAGLPGLTTPVTVEEATDAVRMAKLLADQKPVCPPETRFFYHALTFGWLCGELIRRIDGRSVGKFFSDEIGRPLDLGAWIGLPIEEDGRVAVMEPDPDFSKGAEPDSGVADPVAWSIWENPPRFKAGSLAANTRAWRAAEVPGSSGVADARSMARFYGCLASDAELGGAEILDKATLALATRRLADAVDPFLQKPMAFGVGFELQTPRARFGPPATAFGHTGAGGSVHGAWPELRTGFSYLTATLRDDPYTDPRSDALLRALHEAASR